LLRYPEIAVTLVLLAMVPGDDPIAGLGAWTLAAPVVACLLVHFATATDFLHHLGECYRYIEYGLYFYVPFALGLILPDVAPSLAVVGTAVIVVTGACVAVVAFAVNTRFVPWKGKDELAEFLQGVVLPPGAVVFPIPVLIAGDICARVPHAQSFWHQPGLISEKIFADYFEVWPFLKLEAGPLIERFGVTHAVCDKTLTRHLPGPCHLPGMTKIAESERYVAFVRDPESSPDHVATVLPNTP
jgi:hypothetical protein